MSDAGRHHGGTITPPPPAKLTHFEALVAYRQARARLQLQVSARARAQCNVDVANAILIKARRDEDALREHATALLAQVSGALEREEPIP